MLTSMSMKSLVWIGVTVGGVLGGLLGSLLDHSGIGAWSIILSTAGGLIGIWAGVKIAQNFGE